MIQMSEKYVTWRRRKNLLTVSKTAVTAAVVYVIHQRAPFLTGTEMFLVYVWLFSLLLSLVLYRRFQHEPWVLKELSEKRNTDPGLEPWEFSHPQKTIEGLKLIGRQMSTPLTLLPFVLWSSLSVVGAVTAKVPAPVSDLYSTVVHLDDPAVIFTDGLGNEIVFDELPTSDMFWLWNEETFDRDMPGVAALATEFPDTSFYAVRSYGNDREIIDSLDLPPNIIRLDPRGFNLTDRTDVQEMSPVLVTFDAEGDMDYTETEPDFVTSARVYIQNLP